MRAGRRNPSGQPAQPLDLIQVLRAYGRLALDRRFILTLIHSISKTLRSAASLAAVSILTG